MNKKRSIVVVVLLILCATFVSAQAIKFVSPNGQCLFITYYANGFATAVQNGVAVTFGNMQILDDGTAAFYNSQFGYLFVTLGMKRVCYSDPYGNNYWFFLDY